MNIPNIPEVRVVNVFPKEGMGKIYTNNIDINWTGNDVGLIFGEARRRPDEAGSQPTIEIERKAVVAMSWTQAKMLLAALANVIQKYESANGEIKEPKGF